MMLTRLYYQGCLENNEVADFIEVSCQELAMGSDELRL